MIQDINYRSEYKIKKLIVVIWLLLISLTACIKQENDAWKTTPCVLFFINMKNIIARDT